MTNLLLTTNIVLPIFLLMAVGFCCRQLSIVNEAGFSAINKAVFRIFLPASLCQSIMSIDPDSIVNPSALLFAAVGVTVIFLLGCLIVPRLVKDNRRRGVIIQDLYRSNYAIFGLPVCEALFPQGDGGMAAMMVVIAIPLFNAYSVIALERYRDHGEGDGGKVNFRKIFLGIAKNPLIHGCLIGLVIMQLHIPIPQFAAATLSKLAVIASPLALFALGGAINPQALRGNTKSLCAMVFIRLLFIPAIALSAAYALGYRGVAFAVMMIVFASPCAVSSYTMADQMGGDSDFAAQVVMLTTVFSAFTMFALIFLCKTLGIF